MEETRLDIVLFGKKNLWRGPFALSSRGLTAGSNGAAFLEQVGSRGQAAG
ncbi:MAG: hypothetical protein HYW48_07845 [Deltaproteobacteria bacterium]|nr:hypothetical protein [Deltaproteobacteria bacterium]